MEHIGNDAASPGETSDWHSIDWKAVMQFVGKAQMRIAQAERRRTSDGSQDSHEA